MISVCNVTCQESTLNPCQSVLHVCSQFVTVTCCYWSVSSSLSLLLCFLVIHRCTFCLRLLSRRRAERANQIYPSCFCSDWAKGLSSSQVISSLGGSGKGWDGWGGGGMDGGGSTRTRLSAPRETSFHSEGNKCYSASFIWSTDQRWSSLTLTAAAQHCNTFNFLLSSSAVTLCFIIPFNNNNDDQSIKCWSCWWLLQSQTQTCWVYFHGKLENFLAFLI